MLPIVTVLPLTSVKPGRRVYSIEVFLSAAETGLPKDSIAVALQIRAITKKRLGRQCGQINDEELKEKIKSVIKTYLDL